MNFRNQINNLSYFLKIIIHDDREVYHLCFFWIYIISYLLILMNFSMDTSVAKLRYFILLLCMFYEVLTLIKKTSFEFYKSSKHNDLLCILIVGCFFLLQSFFVAFSNHQFPFFRTYIQIFLLVSPAIYSFLLLNSISPSLLLLTMKKVLYVSVFLYFFEKGHTLLDFFDFSNYTLSLGNSFTESSLFSEIFFQLFLLFNYFVYFRKDKCNIFSKKEVFVSAIFTLLCGKRLAILFVFIIPFLNFILNRQNSMLKHVLIKIPTVVVSLLFVVATVFYFKVLNHEIFTQFNIFGFSTGRDYILSLWRNLNFISFGYGSSLPLIGRYLELDLIQIYLELGLFCLFIFLLFSFRISSKNIYTLLVMAYCMFNMLTASSLPFTMGWIITYISIKLVQDYDKVGDVNV